MFLVYNIRMRGKIISFVIGEVSRTRGGEAVAYVDIKSAPPYAEKAVPKQFITDKQEVDFKGGKGEKAELALKAYKPDTLLAELSFDVPDIFEEGVLEIKERAIDFCIDAIKKRGGKNIEEFGEEYTVYVVSEYVGDPENFLNRDRLAALLKSEKVKLDPHEVDYTLASQLKYENDDLVIVDWDGAFIFYSGGEYEPALKLFELANTQLLRYRLLDREIDSRLQHAVKLVKRAPAGGRLAQARVLREAFQQIIGIRAESISEFQTLERDVKLIGDWYQARLYDLLSKKFRLDGWRRGIQDKLESLEDIYSIASENLGMSRNKVLELIQIFGFFVLQIGWFALIILEFFYFTR